MNCAVEIGQGTMTYVPSFINIGSGIQKAVKDTDQQSNLRSLLNFLTRKAGYKEPTNPRIYWHTHATLAEIFSIPRTCGHCGALNLFHLHILFSLFLTCFPEDIFNC
jgi:hypothetical protein